MDKSQKDRNLTVHYKCVSKVVNIRQVLVRVIKVKDYVNYTNMTICFQHLTVIYSE